MRFSTIFLSTVVAALSVQAQGNNGTVTTATAPVVSGTALPNEAQQSATACLKTCDSDDNDCRAKCQLLANSVNPIANCQAACPKGDGTATDNEKYKECFQSCQTTATQAPSTTAEETSAPDASSKPTSPDGSDDSDDSNNSNDSDDSGVKASGTGSSPDPTETGASNNLRVSFSVCGVLGLSALMLAL